MNIIIVGIGKVGYAVAEQLSTEEHSVTIVDINDAPLADAEGELDVICVKGNGATSKTLLDAGVDDCDLLIALTGSDELNLMCCLIARNHGVNETIARVRNPEYHEEIGILQESLGLTMAVNPEYEAATEILRILTFPAAKNIDVFSRGKIDLVSFIAGRNCALINKPLRESLAKLGNRALACAVERDNKAFIPYGDSVIKEGDTVAFLAAPGDINPFFKNIGMPVTGIKNVMIIGGGRLARYLVGRLCALNMNVTVIELNRETAENLSYAFPNANIICGDGTNRSLLLEEGLRESDALCSLTGFDEENILLSLYAKSMAPKIKTITKVNRTNFLSVLTTLDVGSVIYPKHTTANLILQHVRARQNKIGSNIETLYKTFDNKVEALSFRVGENSSLRDKTLEELRIRKNVIIGCINRDGKVFIPHGKDDLRAGDSVVVVTTIQGLDDLDDIKG
ncbi:MAG: Trk system potassium transporter TrkA [Clostridia bacterium]|nr:Trk system potassium transporter TrkA [Clostridia bacterium]MBQ4244771.1 Trk system potassium transporter TrkA [Clostridia bacterium]